MHRVPIRTSIRRAGFQIVRQVIIVDFVRTFPSLRADATFAIPRDLLGSNSSDDFEFANLVFPANIERARVIIVAIRILVARNRFVLVSRIIISRIEDLQAARREQDQTSPEKL